MIKNKIGYLVLLLITGLFAILYNEYFTGILFLATILLPFIFIMILMIIRKYVRVELDTKDLLVGRNELFDISVKIINKSWFPISQLNLVLEYQNDFYRNVKKEQIQVSIDRSSTQIVTCQIDSSYCGYLNFGVKNIRIYDYFYIWSFYKKLNKSIRVAVVPEYYHITQDFILNNNNIYIDNNNYSEHNPGDDVGEIFGIREYRAGDRPNRIHWKLSHKQDQLIMKEFSDPINSAIVIILDLYCGVTDDNSPNYVDGLIETVLSLSYSCLSKKHMHTLFWYDNNHNKHNKFIIEQEQDLFIAVDALLKAEIPDSYQNVIMNHSQLFYKEQFTHMIYVTAVLNEEEIMNWCNSRKGTFLYLVYVNYLETKSIREEFRYLLKETNVILLEIDIKDLKGSIQAIEL
jgi:uncharacterized protein (DUF58 family)